MSAPERTVVERAPAKINLDLLVTQRLPDGYHELDSLVVFTDLHDLLTFRPADRLSLAITGPEAASVPPGEDNLVLRAARELAFHARIEPLAAITLEKRLPVASGIGGGSADAAATLRGLARLWQLPVPAQDLRDIGARLGADLPVCVYGRPARIRGIGQRIDPVRGLPDLPMLLVNPRQEVATAAVFKVLTIPETPPPHARFHAHPSLTGFTVWLGGSRNDLTEPALGLAPVIGQVLTALAADERCRLTRMSGSGATCFAIYPTEEDAAAAATRLAAEHPEWWVAPTLARGGM